MSRIWLITGCSSGFGRLLAERVFTMGDAVVATARSPQALYDIGREDESRVLRLRLDVADPLQCRDAVAGTIERFGRIDVLVNNAGYGYFGTQEEGEIDEVRLLFETNVFGVINMTQAVLPLMRERREGTIVNLSSVGGRINTPRAGFYQATKWAVEALSESLYLETSEFGIRVLVMEPGAYDTNFVSKSARRAPAEADPESPYASLREAWIHNLYARVLPRRQDPLEVVEAIVTAVNSDLDFLRLPIGEDSTALIARRRELGDQAFVEWMLGAMNARTE